MDRYDGTWVTGFDDGRRDRSLGLRYMVCVSYLGLIVVWPRVLSTGGCSGVGVAGGATVAVLVGEVVHHRND